MANNSDALVEKIQDLSDIELAILICLVTSEHCIIRADPELQSQLGLELSLVCSNTFGLRYAVLDCSETTTLDEFSNGMLVEDEDSSYFGSASENPKDERMRRKESFSYSSTHTSRSPSISQAQRRLANVVVMKNLDKTSEEIQTQALELLRGKRIFTRTAVYTVPKPFLLIALLSAEPDARLAPLLNDHMFISHKHIEEDGFPNLELAEAERNAPSKPKRSILFPRQDIDALIHLETSVRMSHEIRGYLNNIIVFLRMHRAVADGVTPLGSRHLNALSKALAPLHGLSYISPSLVQLATRKVYPHRIVITAPEFERSLQWGSSVEAVREMLAEVTVEDIIEEVLEAVEVPL